MAAPEENQLSTQLSDSSGTFARSALRSQHEDQRFFLLHAATSLEHLTKAVLAKRHPSLIVPANDFESLLHACGEGTSANRTRRNMRTINATDAFDRAARFVPTIKALRPEVDLLIQIRNGVAHLGEPSAEEPDDLLVVYLKVSEELRSALEIDRETYWGEFVDLVDSALKENVKNARLRVETALAIARQEFAKRFGDLDKPTADAMLHVIEAGYAPAKYEEQLLECPACDTPALVFGNATVDYDEDWDHREKILINVHPYVTFIPNGLRCNACGLELSGRDEMDAAGIAEPRQLNEIDERDFLADEQIW